MDTNSTFYKALTDYLAGTKITAEQLLSAPNSFTAELKGLTLVEVDDLIEMASQPFIISHDGHEYNEDRKNLSKFLREQQSTFSNRIPNIENVSLNLDSIQTFKDNFLELFRTKLERFARSKNPNWTDEQIREQVNSPTAPYQIKATYAQLEASQI